MKLAIIGNGKIVTEALIALQSTPQILVNAIFSLPRSEGKAKAFARQYAIPQVFTDYDRLLNEADVDFIYIGIVNSEHFRFSRKALMAGKNVIVEKPICARSWETEELARLAQERNLYLFEAVTFLHAPFFTTLKEWVLRLGPIRIMQCNYSKYSTRYDRYLNHDVAPAFSMEQAGGALYDINIYNLNYAIALFGMPQSIHYFANKGFNGIDTSGIALLQYDGFQCECVGAKDSQSDSFVIIQGELGWLKIFGSPDNLTKIELHLNAASQPEVQVISNTDHRMVDEFRHFQQIFEEQDYTLMQHYLDISLSVSKMAEQARLDTNIIF